MTQKGKIALGIGISISVIGLYWFGVRNREPKLIFDSINWNNRYGEITFGKTTKGFSPKEGFNIDAGATFSDKYNLIAEPKYGKQVIFRMYRRGELIKEYVVDFSSKLKYENRLS